MPEIKLYTMEEFIANPDFKHYELVAGEPIPLPWLVTPMAHGIPHMRLASPLVAHVESNRLGVVTMDRLLTVPDRGTIRVPDLMFASTATLEGIDLWSDDPWPRADLAIEIRSSGQTLPELSEKMTEYFGVGVREVWLVEWRKQTLTKYKPDFSAQTYIPTDILDGGTVVPGFTYPLQKLFAPITIG
jgi:Uma2 family endonuclease